MEQRKPFEELESAAIQLSLDNPGDLHGNALDALRYVIRFAKLGAVRREDGADVELGESLVAFAWQVKNTLWPQLMEEKSLWGAMRMLPELVAVTRERRRRTLEHFVLDRDSLEEEVCTRPLVVVCGGGGGAGYGYSGAWSLLHRRGLQPELIAGTSIGALMGLFRARRRIFDGAPMVEAAKRLSFDRVFRMLESENRYGLPATLRLYLRSALGTLFLAPDGRPLTFADMEIPLLIVTTGIGVEALKHDLSYYEHFLDDAVSHGVRFAPPKLQKITQLTGILRELLSSQESLREVVFGSDPSTLTADVLDAAGFSSSIPGLIHYDVLRNDHRMKHLLDELYTQYGITRLAEGGIMNNVPARPAFSEVMSGRIRRRNAFILSLDCFAPKLRQFMFLPIQQLVRPNVLRNMPFANLYVALEKTLSPINLVPTVPEVTQAAEWTMEQLMPHMESIETHCRPIQPV